LYLTRFVESTADEEHSILPAEEILARSVAGRN